MSKPDSWMPFYVGDYLADTQRLTTAQHGAYLLLMLDYWRAGAPPDDDDVLATIVKATPAEWKRLRAVLAPKFQVVDGVWRHKRIEAELERARANVEQKSAAGKASAEARRILRKVNEKATGVATGVTTEALRNANPSPSPSPAPSELLSTPTGVEVLGGGEPPPEDIPHCEPERAIPSCDHQGVIALYHERLPICPRVLDWNATRQTYLRARWREQAVKGGWQSQADGLEYFGRYFQHVAESKFLTGRTGGRGDKPPFIADLEWLLRPTNFAKVREGKYHGS